ncbi:MAG: LytR/AlgR family response regulator transcription factor [Marvinbryantia sp.]|uniref:LytR/AlgR family response regulator transcription factor n=1 Tax=Marvinbryantia sp. TaxID=2496532 RepID=UPI0025DAED07|nr:LytTR family DNA-binding domain-containing protein [uncultured Marvinbryantia sp.]
MLSIAIVEDSKTSAKRLSEFLERFSAENEESVRPVWFTELEPFLENYHFQYDIVFLDIELPDGNGMEAAKKLREKDPLVVLIFITHLMQYAVNGYEVDALDYMVKPIRYPAFALKMKRAIRQCAKLREDEVMLELKEYSIRISASSIKYIEIYKHHIIYHTENGDYETYGVLKQVENLLPEKEFFRLGSSYIVNFRHIERVDRQYVMIDGKELPISRLRKQEFLEACHSYYIGRLSGKNNA